MAQYLVLIYESEAAWAQADAATTAQIHKEHIAFAQTHGAHVRGGNALHPGASATTIRHEEGGQFTVTDGAFAETKEALAGYYLIEADDLDAAIAIAKDVPAHFGGVEVRPVQVMDMSS